MTPNDYTAQVVALFPRGRLWSWIGSKILGLSSVIGSELSRADDDAVLAREEADTRTISATIDRWESDYGLPSDGTLPERVARVQSKVLTPIGIRPVDYQTRFAPVLGLTPSQVGVGELFNLSPPIASEPLQHYQFYIYRDPALGGTYSVASAQALLDSCQQSHTRGTVIETLALVCDDAKSLTDRDPLEGAYLIVTSGALSTYGSWLVTDASGFLETL